MPVRIKKSFSDIVFDGSNLFIMILLCVTTVYPFLYLLSVSLTPPEVSLLQVALIPKKVVWANYAKVFSSELILSGYFNTLIRVFLGTLLQLITIICTAYPLSKNNFPHKNFWTLFIVFTMFFSGGLIPSYLLVKDLGLRDTVWALILPVLIPTFTMIIVRNFFMTIHPSIEESAKIDGANDITILFRIILPISMPIIATVVLWQAVAHWNAWFDSLIYIDSPKKQVLQIILRMILTEGSADAIDLTNSATAAVNPESVKAATIIATTAPIIAVYPFLQKYFVKGIMVGSLKG